MTSSPSVLDVLAMAGARARGIVRASRVNFFWQPDSDQTVVRALEAWAESSPHDPFLKFEGRTIRVGRFNASVNRAARAYRALGLRRGDVVALFMDNRPAFLMHQYALMKLGVVASLINPNLRGDVLVHAVRVCDPRALVVADALRPAVREVESRVREQRPNLHLLVDHEHQVHEPALDFGARAVAQVPLALASTRELTLDDVAAYIYTSGTTGKPKPAIVKHHRLFRGGNIIGGILGLGEGDCVYLPLPLYHGNGSIVAVPAAIMYRCPLALPRRFSARAFWRECVETEATAFIYVGELCRYLLAQPESEHDRRHQVRRVFGNGMRQDLWEPFKSRFGVERISEYYASTEGNAETVNLLDWPGSCGPMIPWKMALVACDSQTGEVERDPNGRCRRVGAHEAGLLIGKIEGKNEYAGYTSRQATQQKILRDVFAPGDAWFDTGDLLKRDRLLNMYFVDRLGDTFRWRGENVSTQEVAEVLHAGPKIVEANVYGVPVPGQEGRAGMAALVVEGQFEARNLFEYVDRALPKYAQPRFVRLVPEMQTTGTFKQRKVELVKEGYDASIDDPLYVRDPEGRTYKALDAATRVAVDNGQWPL